MRESLLRRITVLAVPACLVLALAEPAAAKPIIIGPFIITLHHGSNTATENSTAASRAEMCAGDGSSIGDVLPPGECIDVGYGLLLGLFGDGSAGGQGSGFGTSTYADPDGDPSFTGVPFDSPGGITASAPYNSVTGPGATGLTWTNHSASFGPGGVGVPGGGTYPGQPGPADVGGTTDPNTTNSNPGDSNPGDGNPSDSDPGTGTDPVIDPIPVPVIDPIPEPASLTLIGTGLAAAALRRRRRSGGA